MSEKSCRNCKHARWNDRGGACQYPSVAPSSLKLPQCTTFLARLGARNDLSYGTPCTGCVVWAAIEVPVADYAHSGTVEKAIETERAVTAKGWHL